MKRTKKKDDNKICKDKREKLFFSQFAYTYICYCNIFD